MLKIIVIQKSMPPSINKENNVMYNDDDDGWTCNKIIIIIKSFIFYKFLNEMGYEYN